MCQSKTLKPLYPTLPINLSKRFGATISRSAGKHYAQCHLMINDNEFYVYNLGDSASDNLTYSVILVGF